MSKEVETKETPEVLRLKLENKELRNEKERLENEVKANPNSLSALLMYYKKYITLSTHSNNDNDVMTPIKDALY